MMTGLTGAPTIDGLQNNHGINVNHVKDKKQSIHFDTMNVDIDRVDVTPDTTEIS